MMKRTKRVKSIAALLLTVVMLTLVMACGVSKKGGESGQGGGQTSGGGQSGDGGQASETGQQTDDGQDGEQNAGGGQTAPEKMTVTDLVGREVTIVPGSYKRVVCIGAGALRMYCYVGDMSLLCGVEDIDNTALSERPKMFDAVARPYLIAYGQELQKLPSCGVGGPNAQTAEAEKILSCDPDIILSFYNDAEKEDALQQQTGVPVITLRSSADGVFGEYFTQSVELLGLIFGKEARARQIIDYVESQRAEISGRTADVPEHEKKAVYLCGLGNWGTTDHLMTAPNEISFTVANVRNAAADLTVKGVQKIEEEKFVSLGDGMDIIIMDTAAVKNIKPLYAQDPTMFDICKAWQDGEVYLQMAYNAYYTNYEIALANAWFMAKTVYPERFSDIDMKAKTDEITQLFLGKKLADEIFAYPASFGGYGKIDTDTFFE